MNVRYRPGPNGLAVDCEGDELANDGMVQEHALEIARSLVKTRITVVRDWYDCSFEVTDELGQHVMAVPFADLVQDRTSLSETEPSAQDR